MRSSTDSRRGAAWLRQAALVTMLAAFGCASDISDPQPPDAVFPTAIVIGEGEDASSYFLRNVGGAPLEWSAMSPVGWLSVEPASGAVAAGDSLRITVRADTANLPPGSSVTLVGIVTNAFNEPAAMQVEVLVVAVPTLFFQDGDTVRVYPQRQGWIGVTAGGRGQLVYDVTTDVEWLHVTSEPSGTLSPGLTTRVHYDIDAWPARDTTVHMIFTSNDAASPLRVPIHVAALPAPAYVFLTHDVTDAAFTSNPERVVIVHGQTLTRIDVQTQDMESLTLPAPARNVDALDARAVVGHDGSVTFVDLNTMTITATASTGLDARDVAIGPFPASLALVIPADAPHASYLRIRPGATAFDTIVAADQPPLLRFADGGFRSALLNGGGIASIEEVYAGNFHAFLPSAEHAPGDPRIWDIGGLAITTTTRMYGVVVYDQWESYGPLDWEGATTPPVIRWAHRSATNHDLLCLLPETPANTIVEWDFYTQSSRVTHLPPVVIAGDPLTVDPQYAWCGNDGDAVVLQREVTAGGDGRWVLGVVAK